MWVTRKIFKRPQIYSFNRFSWDIIFSSLVSFIFLYSCYFFYLFDCFLKLKIYILIHSGPCRQVSDKYFSPGQFPGTRLLFLALFYNHYHFHLTTIIFGCFLSLITFQYWPHTTQCFLKSDILVEHLLLRIDVAGSSAHFHFKYLLMWSLDSYE